MMCFSEPQAVRIKMGRNSHRQRLESTITSNVSLKTCEENILKETVRRNSRAKSLVKKCVQVFYFFNKGIKNRKSF